jgi:hypothetical protein
LKSQIVKFNADPECIFQDLPVWEYNFTCGYDVVAGSLRLEHNDETGQCELIHEVPEEYVEQVVVLEECKTIEEEFSWTVGEGDDAITYTLKVRDADCDTCEILNFIPCCDNPVPDSINAHIIGVDGFGPEGQFADCEWRGSLSFISGFILNRPFLGFAGQLELSQNNPDCFNCCEDNSLWVEIVCDGTDGDRFVATVWQASTPLITGPPISVNLSGAENNGWNVVNSDNQGQFSFGAPIMESADELTGEELAFGLCDPLTYYYGDTNESNMIIHAGGDT